MKDFFISYNHADQDWAEWIAWVLEESSYSVILQTWDFLPGANFILEMDKATTALRTIAVISPDYLNSIFTKPEWASAFANDPDGIKRRLFPIKVRECELSGFLSQIIYLDLVGINEDVAKKKLVDALKNDRNKSHSKPHFPQIYTQNHLKPEFPNQLPRIWNVPYRRNPNFLGRNNILSQIRDIFTSENYITSTLSLIGPAGIGKTQIAMEYIYSFVENYDLIWWLRSDHRITLDSDFLELYHYIQTS